MEPETALVVGGVAIASKDLLVKLLGPTADYLGGELKLWTQKKAENLKHIFAAAERKLGDKIEEEGAVPLRVLKGVVEEGTYCDDPLTAEYFGGVLASSRSGVSRDDRGATFAALLGRLSAYQIRTHYVFYHIVKRLFDGREGLISSQLGRQEMETYVPEIVYTVAMDLTANEDPGVLLPHIMFGLVKERLVGGHFAAGYRDVIMETYPGACEDGIIFQPDAPGVELFLWAHGYGHMVPQAFLDRELAFPLDERVNIGEGYAATKLNEQGADKEEE